MQRLQTFAGWRIHGYVLCVLLCLSGFTNAQTGIARVEYYLDTDPGLGLATAVSFSSQAQLSSLSVGLSPAMLSSGIHRFWIRAKDSNGRWSLAQQLLFFKPGPSSATNAPQLSFCEWFLDTDPGPGNATRVNLLPGITDTTILCSFSATSLGAGVHRFCFRSRDMLGNWGLTQQWLFVKPGPVSVASTLQQLSFGEWYIDTDPGRGNANRVSILPGTIDTSVICSFSPASLSNGIHRFCFRAKDTLGNWSSVQQWLFWKPAPLASDTKAKITYLEYFVDNDPGLGNATIVTSFTPDTSVTIQAIALPVAGLSAGLHKFNLRGRDSSGAWSLVQQLTFLKLGSTTNATPAPPLAFGEWYVDNDPGYGAATRISLPSGTYDTSLIVSMPIGNLNGGIHRFCFRAKDTLGKWSLLQQLLFYKPGTLSTLTARAKINYAEYYLDTDPGKGAATAITGFTPDTAINISPISISVGSLSAGLHRLSVRGRDSIGNWSLEQQLLFFKPSATVTVPSSVPIIYAEWYVDNDPGLGVATPLSFSSGTTVNNAIAPLNAVTLSAGVHRFYIRAKDSLGRWGLAQQYLFYKPSAAIVSSLYKTARLEYYIDTDPGLGSGTPVSITPDTLITNQLVSVSTNSLSLGLHKLYLRALDSSGKWSLVNSSSFTLISSRLSVSTVASGKCAGTSLTIPYAVSTTFNAGNKFRVQLSNAAGAFADTSSIGSKFGTTSDSIVATIPANTVAGLNYRVRVLASSPADTSAPNSLPLEIKNTPTAAFTVSGSVLTCADTEAYFISPVQSGVNYSWYLPAGGTLLTTGTTAYVAWTSAGSYVITGISSNTCGNGRRDSITVAVFNGGTTTAPALSLSVNTINITNTAPSGTTGYEWYRNDTLIATTSVPNYTVSVNGNYKAAFVNSCGPGTRSSALAITHLKLFQSITFPSIANKVYSDPPFKLNATASSSLPVSYAVTYGPATLAGDTIVMTAAGTVFVTASQAGDATYAAATSVTRTFTVAQLLQSVSFTVLNNRLLSDTPVILSATASSNLPVTFSVVSGPATAVYGTNQLLLTGCGQITVRAIQSGSTNYQSAYFDRSFCVWPRQPDSIYGYTQACTATVMKYYTKAIIGVTNRWTISGGTLQSNIGDTVVANWTSNGLHSLSVRPDSMCNAGGVTARTLSVQVAAPAAAGKAINLFPLDSAIVAGNPLTFSWSPVSGAGKYHLYLWPADSVQPVAPKLSGITQTSATIYTTQLPGYRAGKWYKWKVVTDNGCSQRSSDTQSFRISPLPDLIVSAITAPDTVFSGTSPSIDLTVKNIGQAITTAGWYDQVYLSPDSQLTQAVLFGSRTNVAALDTTHNYINSFQINLPKDYLGLYRIIARTDGGNSQPETADTNNTRVKDFFIKLTPPPDLQVTSVVSPGGVFSGKTLSVSYTVKNFGTGSTIVGSWHDRIYISTDPTGITGTATLLDDITRSGAALLPDSSYTRSRTVTIPAAFYGRYYIHVATDAYNNVYEYVFETNNSRRNDSLDVYLSPTPDFKIINFNAPANISVGEQLGMDYTVRNESFAREVKDSVWTDGIYISSDSTYPVGAAFIGSVMPDKVLHPACSTNSLGTGGCRYVAPLMGATESYYKAYNFTVPSSVHDSFYLFAVTDNTDNIFERYGENNNWARKKVYVLNPDLSVTSVSLLSASLTAGNSTSITWTVKNAGPGKVKGRTRTDKISLSPTPIYNTATIVPVSDISYSADLDPTSAYTQTRAITIPPQLSGTYYFFIETDYGNVISETDESNNRQISSAVTIVRPSPPDLRLQSLAVANDTLVSDTSFGISFQVENNGAPLAGKSWKDHIYISGSPVWNATSASLLKSITQTRSLATNASYMVTDSLTIPMSLLRSLGIKNDTCYFYVFTDAADDVSEWGLEGNNILSSSPIFALDAEHPDLAGISLIIPDTILAGANGAATFTVKNLGGKTGRLSNSWLDGLYLSQDTFKNGGDVQMGIHAISSILNNNDTYTNTYSFTAPRNVSGLYHIVAVADVFNANEDKDTSNNHRVARQGSIVKQIYVRPIPPADLTVASLVVPASGKSGQPLRVRWTVKNQSANVTNAAGWTERIYLSKDAQLDVSDAPLASYSHGGALSPSASYADSMDVSIPMSAQGNYYVLLKTDDNDNVYEGTNEGNNVANAYTFIILPPPADLIVHSVMIDSVASVGDTVKVLWTLQNIGTNVAGGYLKQGIYLSSDTLYGNGSILMADLYQSISLAPSASRRDSVLFKVKGIRPGSYTAIIRADLLNNINETSETNNNGASVQPTIINVARLPLDTMKHNVLRNGGELFYRIDIPASLAGETILVSLKGDSLQGNNELYLRYDSIPARNKYDFVYTKALSGNQDIIIPAAQAGTYYVMVYGVDKLATQQSVSLLAQRIVFSIRSISASSGGNTGKTTVRLDGAKYVPGMTAKLRSATFGTIVSQSVYYSGSTTIFASFNLAGKATGTYDVVLTKSGGDTAVLGNGFTIVTGSAGSTTGGGTNSGFYCNIVNTGVEQLLATNIQHPSNTRPNTIFAIRIEYGNGGNVDIPVPTRLLVNTSGEPISTTTSGLADKKGELFLEFRELNGPPDVLRPGAFGYITIFTKSGAAGTMHFELIEQ